MRPIGPIVKPLKPIRLPRPEPVPVPPHWGREPRPRPEPRPYPYPAPRPAYQSGAVYPASRSAYSESRGNRSAYPESRGNRSESRRYLSDYSYRKPAVIPPPRRLMRLPLAGRLCNRPWIIGRGEMLTHGTRSQYNWITKKLRADEK